MSKSFRPDQSAEPVPPWSTSFLSQRDLTIQIPLNYVTYPGVSLKQACFGSNVYDDRAASRCLSNLLGIGFRRFVVDVYWDWGRHVWSLCPAQTRGSSLPASPSSSSSAVASPTPVKGLEALLHLRSSVNDALRHQVVRQAPAISGSALRDGDSNPTSSASQTSSTLLASSTATPINGQAAIQIGPYSCTSTIDLSLVTQVVAEYLKNTSTTLDAFLTFLIFNVHVASPFASPEDAGPTLDQTTLPTSGELLSAVVSTNLSSLMYTPAMLRVDRANLNTSWLSPAPQMRPDFAYLNATKNAQGILSTANGWPSESYVGFQRGKRLFVGFGQVDRQLQQYDLAGDTEVIFNPEELMNSQNISFSMDGDISEGCFFSKGNTNLASLNNSWATTNQLQTSSLSTQQLTNLSSISNLTACGISPLLDSTLGGSSADLSFVPYQSIAFSSIWSWAPGEPRNVSSSESNSNRIRCAGLDPHLGRWRISNCSDYHYAACRVGNGRYDWMISSDRKAYNSIQCPSGSSFAVPRSGLENSYLLAVVSNRSDASTDDLIWVNFNSISAQGCWVSGVNSTCPYTQSTDPNAHRRAVVVPTVAAVVVFVVAALLVFVKCAANRRTYKRGRRRRAADEAGDYEGVPS